MSQLLRHAFANKLTKDERMPIVTIGDIDVYAPVLQFWTQLTVLLLIQIICQVTFAAMIYKLIVQQRNANATFAYLLGWGVIIPLSLYLPFEILEFCDVQNHALKLSVSTLGTIVPFRTIEAMYGTSPAIVESNMGTYMVYYSSLFQFEWNESTGKRRRITKKEFISTTISLTAHFLMLSGMLSILRHYSYQVVDSPVKLSAYNIKNGGWQQLLSPAHLTNAYLLAILVYLVLSVCFGLAAYADNIQGYYTQPIFRNPLFASRSPTEFWSRRWNLCIHSILKTAVFKPMRQYYGTNNNAGVAAAFCASGFLHDYAWMLVFYRQSRGDNYNNVCKDCFRPLPYKLTAFFCYSGLVMLLERPINKMLGLSKITKSWPTVFVSTLVVLTTLPVSHWYSGDWADGGFFDDFAIGLLHLKKR